jgi:very-short-patch-repair endonuclease
MSDAEDTFLYQLKASGLPIPEREYHFHYERKWRFDFAFPDRKIAVEIEGGTWTKGRHTRPAGFAADCEKYNEATRLGWQVYRFTTGMIMTGEALEFIEEVLR